MIQPKEERMTLDEEYRWKIGTWIGAIGAFTLLTLFRQASLLDRGVQEREYLRERLFSEMDLRTEEQRIIALQKQTHALYEAEIALLKRQMEMVKVDRYVAKINRRLREGARWQIVRAVYGCSAHAGVDP